MGELLTILADDVEDTERNVGDLLDADLTALYESLVVTRIVDERCARLQQSGRIGFWAPSGTSAAVSAGAARAFEDGDWLYPSYRDIGAFLVRGGSIEQLFTQVLSSRDDLARGRQLPGHATLPAGRFVSVSGPLATQIQHAAGTALAMKLRNDAHAVLALFGAAATDQAAFQIGLSTAARHAAPVVFVCRCPGVSLAPIVKANGVAPVSVDGTDILAVYMAARSAREAAVAGAGPTLIEAVVPKGTEALEPAARLRPYLEHRGVWDAGREEEFGRRCEERVAAAVALAESAGPPPADTMFDDVWATRPWMLQEQSRKLRRLQDRTGYSTPR
jgi:TPP-dependent pyruvate/acetoin dehydrogenase alpha subunit